MHQELFEDDDDKKKRKINSQPFSISRNIIQRKNIETNNMEMNREFTADSNNKTNNDSMLNAMEKFNDSVKSTNRKAIEKLSRVDGKDTSNSNSSQSFFQFLKSAFSCNTSSSNIVEQTELNYPLNLHLRMNEIFSMHDKLCDIAECFNDLYSIGKSFTKFYFYFFKVGKRF